VRLLVDANLSPRVAQTLRDNGHDAVHVIDVGLATATDTEIAARADFPSHWLCATPGARPSPATSMAADSVLSLGPWTWSRTSSP
jgi:hypothetical protein